MSVFTKGLSVTLKRLGIIGTRVPWLSPTLPSARVREVFTPEAAFCAQMFYPKLLDKVGFLYLIDIAILPQMQVFDIQSDIDGFSVICALDIKEQPSWTTDESQKFWKRVNPRIPPSLQLFCSMEGAHYFTNIELPIICSNGLWYFHVDIAPNLSIQKCNKHKHLISIRSKYVTIVNQERMEAEGGVHYWLYVSQLSISCICWNWRQSTQSLRLQHIYMDQTLHFFWMSTCRSYMLPFSTKNKLPYIVRSTSYQLSIDPNIPETRIFAVNSLCKWWWPISGYQSLKSQDSFYIWLTPRPRSASYLLIFLKRSGIIYAVQKLFILRIHAFTLSAYSMFTHDFVIRCLWWIFLGWLHLSVNITAISGPSLSVSSPSSKWCLKLSVQIVPRDISRVVIILPFRRTRHLWTLLQY